MSLRDFTLNWYRQPAVEERTIAKFEGPAPHGGQKRPPSSGRAGGRRLAFTRPSDDRGAQAHLPSMALE